MKQAIGQVDVAVEGPMHPSQKGSENRCLETNLYKNRLKLVFAGTTFMPTSLWSKTWQEAVGNYSLRMSTTKCILDLGGKESQHCAKIPLCLESRWFILPGPSAVSRILASTRFCERGCWKISHITGACCPCLPTLFTLLPRTRTQKNFSFVVALGTWN